VPQVEVTFDIDANGIVHVSAKDKASNKEQSIRIEAGGGMSEDDIQSMVDDAQANEAEDKEKKEGVDTRNQADSLCYQVERSLKDYADKIDAADKSNIEAKLKETRDALEADDTAQIKAAMEALTEASHKLAEQMYKQDGGAEGAQPEASGPEAGAAPADDNVVDAEFEETT
jgi:molecular chaperone DnaK